MPGSKPTLHLYSTLKLLRPQHVKFNKLSTAERITSVLYCPAGGNSACSRAQINNDKSTHITVQSIKRCMDKIKCYCAKCEQKKVHSCKVTIMFCASWTCLLHWGQNKMKSIILPIILSLNLWPEGTTSNASKRGRLPEIDPADKRCLTRRTSCLPAILPPSQCYPVCFCFGHSGCHTRIPEKRLKEALWKIYKIAPSVYGQHQGL